MVPLVGETDSQLPPEVVLAEAVYGTLGPVALMLTCCEGGFDPPVDAVKDSVVGATVTVLTLNVTFKTKGLLVAPAAVRVTVPV